MTGVFEASGAIQWGNFPQWISAGVAVVVLLGAATILIHSGRRTDFEVQASAVEAADGQSLLDVRLKLKPVGAWRVMPYWPVECECTENMTLEPGSELKTEAWTQPEPCAKAIHWDRLKTRDPRLPTLRKKGGGMTRRRNKWGCPNRRVPRIDVYEIRSDSKNPGSHFLREQQRHVATIMNPIRGQFAEPHEQLNVTHTVPVDRSDDGVLGWRIVASIWVPMESWFLRPTWSDSWLWEDDDFVIRTEVASPTGAHAIGRSPEAVVDDHRRSDPPITSTEPFQAPTAGQPNR
jgi:hypothetical protein